MATRGRELATMSPRAPGIIGLPGPGTVEGGSIDSSSRYPHPQLQEMQRLMHHRAQDRISRFCHWGKSTGQKHVHNKALWWLILLAVATVSAYCNIWAFESCAGYKFPFLGDAPRVLTVKNPTEIHYGWNGHCIGNDCQVGLLLNSADVSSSAKDISSSLKDIFSRGSASDLLVDAVLLKASFFTAVIAYVGFALAVFTYLFRPWWCAKHRDKGIAEGQTRKWRQGWTWRIIFMCYLGGRHVAKTGMLFWQSIRLICLALVYRFMWKNEANDVNNVLFIGLTYSVWLWDSLIYLGICYHPLHAQMPIHPQEGEEVRYARGCKRFRTCKNWFVEPFTWSKSGVVRKNEKRNYEDLEKYWPTANSKGSNCCYGRGGQ